MPADVRRVNVARLLADQWRPLVSVWLLFTLPVICHNDTAAVLLGAIGAGHVMQHPAGPAPERSGAHAHHVPDAGSLAVAADVAGPPAAHPGTAPEWCAAHGARGVQAWPSGQDAFALVGGPSLLAISLPRSDSRPPGAMAVDPLQRPPPAPPPEALA